MPLISWPFDLHRLPLNGIYFFYEKGQIWGHGEDHPGIVRIGTHKQGNFRSRISEHFLFDERSMGFDASRPAPHDRSIFRKNLGRALLNRDADPYLRIWELDFTSRQSREKSSHLRDIIKEKQIESDITKLLRESFAFRFIVLDDQNQRLGRQGLESRLIGTVAQCLECRRSESWLGRYSPKPQIRDGNLWLVQHLKSPQLTDFDQATVADAARLTLKWIAGLEQI